MEILRKTQGINSFLQINVRQPAPSFSFEEKMLRNNRLKSLPPLSFQKVDDELFILYKTDGKTSLPRSWSAGGPGRTEVQRLLSDLASCVRELQDYLLSPERLVLSLPFILYDGGTGRAVFLYVPEPGPAFSESMKRLFEEIMPIYSAEREEEQIWFYDLYSRFLDGSFTPELLLSLTAQWSRPGNAGGGTADRTEVSGFTGGRVLFPLQEEPEPYILPETAVREPDGLFSGWRLVAGIIVAVLAAVLYLWLGAASLRISALLVGGYAVVLILTILSGGREKPAVCRQNAVRERRDPDIREEPAVCVPDAGRRKEMEPAYPGTVRSYGGAESSYPGTDRSYGGAESSYPGTDRSCGGAESSYPGTDRSYRGTEPPVHETGQPSTDVLHPRIERLVPVKGEPRIPLYVSEGYCRIGRSEEENEYCIPAPAISRNHARLECVGDVVTLRDLGSTNGTYLNHMRLPGEAVAELHCGDVVSFAGEEFYVV